MWKHLLFCKYIKFFIPNLQLSTSLGTNLHFWRFCTHARCEYNFTCLASFSPHPTETGYFSRVSTLYWVGRGEQQHVFERIAVLFTNFSCKTQIICCSASVSQGLLFTTVAIPGQQIRFFVWLAGHWSSWTSNSCETCSSFVHSLGKNQHEGQEIWKRH